MWGFFFGTHGFIVYKLFYIGRFYANAGSDIPFGKLFVELAQKFPPEKIQVLKYLIECKFFFLLKRLMKQKIKIIKGKGYFTICFFFIVVSCNIEFDEDTAKKLEKTKSAADVLKFLHKKEIFKPSDVIAMQFLLQETGCEELEKKCVEYAKRQNAMYYYETPPGIILKK